MTYLWLLLIIPIAWFVQNCIHEGSHLLFGWLEEGRKPLEFKPWPHRFEGRFYFARYAMGEATKDGLTCICIRHAAPVLVNSIYITLMSVLTVLHMVFAIFVLCTLVDLAFWVYGFYWGSELSDGQRFRDAVRGVAR